MEMNNINMDIANAVLYYEPETCLEVWLSADILNENDNKNEILKGSRITIWKEDKKGLSPIVCINFKGEVLFMANDEKPVQAWVLQVTTALHKKFHCHWSNVHEMLRIKRLAIALNEKVRIAEEMMYPDTIQKLKDQIAEKLGDYEGREFHVNGALVNFVRECDLLEG